MSSKNHKAIYAGKTHNQTKTRWIQTLDTNGAALDRLLIKHGSMQSVIDNKFTTQERRDKAIDAFLRRPVTS